jgi:stearoyl-CoA desaturase (delta-9 desaturase)
VLHVFALTAGYHRYFSHKSFKTSRVFQFILAVLGATAAQRDPLWWASHHRMHHQNADTEDDPHSPRHHGFWWAHMGWVMKRELSATQFDRIRDFARYPELMWLNRHPYAPAFILAALLLASGALLDMLRPGWGVSGPQFLFYGFFLSTVAVYHVTFCINSVAHLYGTKRYEVDDDSRNNWILGLLAMGEGWHNNHHRYSVCTRQGFRWWEIDLSYLILRFLQFLGIVWDIREPPQTILVERK